MTQSKALNRAKTVSMARPKRGDEREVEDEKSGGKGDDERKGEDGRSGGRGGHGM